MAASQPMKRVQVLLPMDSYDILQRLAVEAGWPVSALVRDVIEERLVKGARKKQVAEAVARLCDGDTPVMIGT